MASPRTFGTAALFLCLVSLQIYVNKLRLQATIATESWSRSVEESREIHKPLDDGKLPMQHSTQTVLETAVTAPPLPSAPPLCTSEQLKDGKWVPMTLPEPPYISKTTHLRCPHSTKEHFANHSYETHVWIPSSDCSFDAFDRTEFCRVAKYTTISIIGDSLSWEHYSSLLQSLKQRVHQSDTHKSRSQRRNHVQSACRGAVRIVFRNDARLDDLQDSMQQDFPTVLVLNRGAHYVEDEELEHGMSKTIDTIKQWQSACMRMNVTCHFFWRTSVPGHPNCLEATEPVNNLQQMRDIVNDLRNYDRTTLSYHWQDFERQNNLVLKMLSEAASNSTSVFNYTILPAFEVNMLRPDLHRTRDEDCLHNCYPGKMDVYTQMLFHFLKRERPPAVLSEYARRYRQAYKKYQQKLNAMRATEQLNESVVGATVGHPAATE
ncbi:hypothetical protein MPSEU_000262500 [Mayamaea pseudoterrestris]|nr:hypothetical protein MPSEU_000262500 [Mayamaea pseudoterrestris]